MQVDKKAYPQLTGLKANYGDMPDRVYWRSKQVVDYAFMFYHGRNLSQYYIQIEDDVICAPKFYPAIKAFISDQTKPWITLRFATLGFIGKLYKSTDLRLFAQFLMLFYQEMPIDYLYRYFHHLLTYSTLPLRNQSIFQHIGHHSSLTNKSSFFQEQSFEGDKNISLATFVGDPPALIHTTMEHFQHFIPQNAYSSNTNVFFWGKTPKVNDTFTVIFKESIKLKHVKIQTGHDIQRNNFLERGSVEVSPASAMPSGDKSMCHSYIHLGEFVDGHYEDKAIQQKLRLPVKCLRIRITKTQKEWIIISLFSAK